MAWLDGAGTREGKLVDLKVYAGLYFATSSRPMKT